MTTMTTVPALTIKRHIAAPQERVFAAWTQPQHLKNWWGHEGFTAPITEVELKTGGQYKLGMLPPNETEPHIVTGTFREIDPPNKLVYSWEWVKGMENALEMVVTVEFVVSGNGTDILLTHTGFDTEDSRGKHNGGWNGVIDNLNKYLTTKG